MEFPRIVLKVNAKNFSQLVNLASRVFSSLTGNLDYPIVSPALSILQTDTSAVVNAIAVWGPKGSRGSHDAYVDLCEKAAALHLTLKEIAQFCANTAEIANGSDYAAMKTMLSGSGFELAKAKTMQPLLEVVQKLRNLSTRNLNVNQVKWKWSRPLNTSNSGDVSNYQVLKASTPNFSAAVAIANVTKGEFVDTNTTGASVTWYYWIVPYNSAGAGVVSPMVSVTLSLIS